MHDGFGATAGSGRRHQYRGPVRIKIRKRAKRTTRVEPHVERRLFENPRAATPIGDLGCNILRRSIGHDQRCTYDVNERLKVLFGADYRMWIDSKPGQGTRIEIEVPELQTRLAAVS